MGYKINKEKHQGESSSALMKRRVSFLESPFQICMQQATAGPWSWLGLKCSAYSVAHVPMCSSGRQVCPSLYGNQPSVRYIFGHSVRRQLQDGWSSCWSECCASAIWLCHAGLSLLLRCDSLSCCFLMACQDVHLRTVKRLYRFPDKLFKCGLFAKVTVLNP